MFPRAICVAACSASVVVAIGLSPPCHGGAADDARKKAQRVSSYVLVAETITRVGLQVGRMLETHPYDKALSRYARELGRLHAKLYAGLTPPPGADDLHRHFREAVAGFAKSAEAHCAADYAAARGHREKCLRDFTRALAEVVKLRREGTIP